MNKLTALVEAAKAATPGPWDSYKSIVEFPQQEAGGFSLSNCPRAYANAEFIALANPATILELCALLEQAEEALLSEDVQTMEGLRCAISIEALAAIKQWKEQI